MPTRPDQATAQSSTKAALAWTKVTDFFAYERSDGTKVARSQADDTVALAAALSGAGGLGADGLKHELSPGRAADVKSAASWGQVATSLYEISAIGYRAIKGIEKINEHKINNLAKVLTFAGGAIKAATDGFTDEQKTANPRIKKWETVGNWMAAVGVGLDVASRVNTQRQEKLREVRSARASQASSPDGSVHELANALADVEAQAAPAREAAAGLQRTGTAGAAAIPQAATSTARASRSNSSGSAGTDFTVRRRATEQVPATTTPVRSKTMR